MINKKKKEEFVKTCLEDPTAKILVIQGPSGCGKNSLIDCFGDQYKYEVVRYKDTNKTRYDAMDDRDTFGDGEKLDEFTYYPDDLNSLIGYISGLSKMANSKTSATTSFGFAKSSFLKKSSFAQKNTTPIKSSN